MNDREERQHVIKVLKNMLDWMEAANKISSKPERIEAVKYAIASIETDLKYDLLYEETSGQADKPTTKNNLGVDAVSRQAVLNTLDNMDSALDEDRTVETYKELLKECYKILPSVTPQEPKFIAKSDGTIEQIKNCNGCVFRKEWEKIGKLLSVVLEKQTEQEPKTGHWIETAEEYYKAINEKGGGVNESTDYFTDDIACSECLAKFSVIDNEAERFDFCPCCGSDNR